MSAKKNDILPTAESKYPLEVLITLALVVPMRGDPSHKSCVRGLPILLWGDPGVGKSDRIEETATRLGLHCEVAFPSTQQPEDVTGVLVPDGKGGAQKVCLLDSVNTLSKLGSGVLFVDELTGARPATQGAWLGAILKRQFGDVKMPGAVRIIAAANPPEQAAGGGDLELPMANRFAHFTVPKPSGNQWTTWLLSEDAPRETSIADYDDILIRNWSRAWARSRGLFAGFAKRAGDLLHAVPEEGSPNRGRAWPSPRTWYYAARAAATCFALNGVLRDEFDNPINGDDLALDFVSACVGAGAAVSFATWMKEANLPDPKDVLDNGWAPDKKRLDRTIAVYTAMTAYVLSLKEPKARVEYANKAWKVLGVAVDAHLNDMIAPSASALVHNGLGYGNLDTKATAGPVLYKLGKTKVGDMIEQFDPGAK